MKIDTYTSHRQHFFLLLKPPHNSKNGDEEDEVRYEDEGRHEGITLSARLFDTFSRNRKFFCLTTHPVFGSAGILSNAKQIKQAMKMKSKK